MQATAAKQGTMDASEDAAVPLCVTDEDALLLEALAFIGDLGVDSSEDDDLASVLWQQAPEAPPPTATEAVPAILAPPFDVSTVPQAAVSPDSPVDETAETKPVKWPGELRIATEPAPGAVPSRSNNARVRRREELLYLRGLVGDLEDRLSGLRAAPNDAAGDSSSETVDTPSELVDAWEQVASRQYEQRQRAELENIKLRRLLNDQIQLGKSLEKLLLRKRPNVEAFEAEGGIQKRLRRTNSRSRNTEQVFEELLADCAALYADTARIKTKFDAIPSAKPRRDVQLVHDPEQGMTVQTTEQRIMPFGLEFTADVLWSCLPDPSTVLNFYDYRNKDLSDDTMKLQFRVTSDIGRKRSDFDITMAMRRYVEANRTVIVMSAIFDPKAIHETRMGGVRMRHSGWHILEPTPCHAFQTPREATNLFVHHVAVPDVDDDLQDEARKVGTLSNFLLGAIAVEMEARNQNFDDRLMEKSLRGSSSD